MPNSAAYRAISDCALLRMPISGFWIALPFVVLISSPRVTGSSSFYNRRIRHSRAVYILTIRYNNAFGPVILGHAHPGIEAKVHETLQQQSWERLFRIQAGDSSHVKARKEKTLIRTSYS